ncbi:MAG: bifunctional 4-hydroxy-2-oxoglutarate aldolase/2-dehydro-3-deoxy-phosphogluconate aldolase [Gemmatimonadaceae bacterium]|nr:bifunctional 4-hydroxy-2-oxoglutarate aldolase/2-dehydro-3-deoxy-phosphogluconate aldolase [Gemmatimonadaceae bacterium]NUQ93288.1 bifunctional 4-hydroxy-2-oxoglutarate aldolase/2-dehydro-3-deoxy-phosphogluconate aldolase [Gemmatimonadaceae bacterium]NUR18932.1 bifunctional 4-hydroxy-2-oxoglutarate aldolase/2-dehydro-3-deoxy-phosphogluconate aldolase [Gemmatimonadaceae bacterium]NUS98821.1 bifunctional 4-hydroxy-2-oxoglutarate aldolase/2-dehydro-3-deoxy-phosphogluconate aldolase [Gemmatimonad
MTKTPPARTRQALTEEIIACGAIAVVRLKSADGVLRAIEAIREGGVRAIELTMTTPNAVGLLAEARRAFGDDVLVGIGSVLDVEQTRRAVDAGARYVVSPVFRRAVIDEAHRLGVPAMPAGFTPTEILDAHEAGADIVKITPAEVLGPAFIKGVLAPMPFLRVMPTGGVTTENVGEWLRAGAVAVGVGSALVDAKLVAAGEFATLTERARRMVAGVEQARRGGAR